MKFSEGSKECKALLCVLLRACRAIKVNLKLNFVMVREADGDLRGRSGGGSCRVPRYVSSIPRYVSCDLSE